MALTVNTQPQTLTPAYNKQVFIATSTQTAVADFKYIVTIEVNGSGDIFTENILAAPDTTMTFDAKEYVKNYIEHYFNPSISLAAPCVIATNKTVSVEVKIKEYYTSAIQSTTTINYSSFGASLTESEFASYNYTAYLLNSSTPILGLATPLIDDRVSTTDDVYFHFINYPTTPYTEINIINLTTTDDITITIPTATKSFETYVLNATPRALPSVSIGDRLLIVFVNSNPLLDKNFNYTITDICTNYTDYKLYYLDKTGNILFFNFELLSQETINKKTNIVRLAKQTSNTWEREKHIVSTQTTKQIVLNSNWITESQSTALQSLFDSPIVWLYLNQVYTPITITDTNYKLSKLSNEPLFNYSLTCEYGETNTRQRGI